MESFQYDTISCYVCPGGMVESNSPNSKIKRTKIWIEDLSVMDGDQDNLENRDTDGGRN